MSSPLILPGVQTVMEPFYNPMGAVAPDKQPKRPKVFQNAPLPMTGGAKVAVFEGTSKKAPATKPFYGMIAPGRY